MRSRNVRALPLRIAVALSSLLLLASCADRGAIFTAPEPNAPAGAVQSLTCEANVREGRVRCGTGSGISGESGALGDVSIIGGQGINVRMASSNVAYDSVTEVFSFDATVQNLLPEALGTRDGVNLDASGVRVFFSQLPTVNTGSGVISVNNADGAETFTEAGQPYYQYNAVLDSGQVSGARRWEFQVPQSVGTFTFRVFVAAQSEPLLVITEVMANPAGAVQDSSGEYVEVFNRGRLSANLNGLILRDNSSAADTIHSDLVVPSGSYVLLVRSANVSKNGGLAADYAYTVRIGGTSTSLTFSNSGADRFVIRTASGVIVDSVSYTSAAIAAKGGVARELKDPTLDNVLVDGANWQDATHVYDTANNNKGTPRTAPDGSGGSTAGPPVSVSVSPGAATIAPNGTRQFSATARDSAGTPTAATLTWSVADTSVARVNGTGLVTGIADGVTLVIVQLAGGQADSATVTVSTPATSSLYRNHLEFGMPVGADSNGIIVLNKPEYVVGYKPLRGGPAWVSWNLNSTHFGPADRCDCFTPDAQLPDSVYKVVTGDYTGSGYSRGHMVMSEQRTQTAWENQQTFLTTNILPQLQDMNGGPWLQFEILSNDSARAGREVYNIAGGLYSASPATLNNAGKVQIPTHTWKVIVIMGGGQGLAQVTSAGDIRVIAVSMPNQAGIQSNPWTMYVTTVDAIEAATGYDLLSALPDAIEAVVES